MHPYKRDNLIAPQSLMDWGHKIGYLDLYLIFFRTFHIIPSKCEISALLYLKYYPTDVQWLYTLKPQHLKNTRVHAPRIDISDVHVTVDRDKFL